MYPGGVHCSDSGVDDRFLITIDGSGWGPFRDSVGVDAAGPASAGEVVMVIAAEQSQIIHIRFAAINPRDEVMSFAPFRGSIAARKGAPGVAGDQRRGLAAGRDPSGPAQIEYNPVAVQERVVGLGLIGHGADLVGAE